MKSPRPQRTRLNRTSCEQQPVLVSRTPDLPFDYRIVRSMRKTLAVHVRDALVEVRAPVFVGDREISVFIGKHRDWVLRKLAHKAQQADQRLRIEDGAPIWYKARLLQLQFVESQHTNVSTARDRLVIEGRNLTPKRAQHILEAWLLAQAKDWLPSRTRALAAYLQVDHKLKEVVFRKTRSKWGHCTSSGRIQYNWLIMLAPDAIIDYMVCHETCHLLEMNHSKRYWRHVESVCPDYRAYIKWLKQHEHRLWPQAS